MNSSDSKVGTLTTTGTTITSRVWEPASSTALCSSLRRTSYRPSSTGSAAPDRISSPVATGKRLTYRSLFWLHAKDGVISDMH